MRCNARHDRSHHELPHPLKDEGVAADSLTCIHITTVNCLFVVNRSSIHKGFYVSPQVKNIEDSGQRGGHAVGPLLAIYRS
jgi:hypothetical protein